MGDDQLLCPPYLSKTTRYIRVLSTSQFITAFAYSETYIIYIFPKQPNKTHSFGLKRNGSMNTKLIEMEKLTSRGVQPATSSMQTNQFFGSKCPKT